MGKSNSYYMQLHVEALFTMNEKNELMTIREPWGLHFTAGSPLLFDKTTLRKTTYLFSC